MPDSFDVAISVATPDEPVARELVGRLKRRNLSAYVYTDAPGQLAGADLEEALQQLYGAAFVVVFVHSAHWRTPYTEVELAAATSGAAAQRGLWIIRLDETPLPSELEGRVYWPDTGLDRLAVAVARSLGVRALQRWQQGAAAIALSALLALAALTLGFVDVTRVSDQLAWTAAAIPAGWALLYRVLPDVRQALARRGGIVAVETPLERAWERSAGLLGVGGLALGGLALALALQGRQAALAERDALTTAWSLVDQAYSALRPELNACSTDVARVQVQQDEASASRFRACGERATSRLAELAGATSGMPDGPPTAAAAEVDAAREAVTRTLLTNLAYQVDTIVDSTPTRRRIAVELASNYNTLLAEQLTALEDAVRALQRAIDEARAQGASRWAGYVDGTEA